VNDTEQDLEPLESKELGFPKPSQDEIGWLLVGGGIVGSLINLLRGDRGPVDWLIPLGLAGVGVGVLLQGRQSRMDSAADTILAELDALDPIARAQVLKAVARDEVDRLPGVRPSD